MANLKLEQGKRLRALRQRVGLTLKELAKLSGVGESTLRQWETGRSSGISVKGAHKIVNAFKSYQVECEADWFIEGKGAPPEFGKTFQLAPHTKIPQISVEMQIENEIKFFCENANKPIFARINDHAMLPFYMPGAYVGGNLCPEKNINLLHNKLCIITLANSDTIVRKLTYHSQSQAIHLHATNEKLQSAFPPLFNAKILSAALITRVWCPSLII